MKLAKKMDMIEVIAEFIADHDINNRHYLTDDEIIKLFEDMYKKKHIKKALKEIR